VNDARGGDDDESRRFSKWGGALSGEMGDGREHRGSTSATKCDEVRRRCEVRTLYSSPNTSPATPIDGARQPVWVLSSRYFERASIGRWQGIRAGAPPTLLIARNPRAAEQRDTPSKIPLVTILPRTGRSPDRPRGGSDKPLRSGPKIDRSPADHGANAADHHGGARPKKRLIGGIKTAIGRQMIAKEA
jgi:hypothetical protein